jgi:hypothetical protein
VIDAISNAIDAIDNAADFIKTFGHYPLTTESLRQAVEGLQSLQNRGEADHDALNDLWACAESGYSLDDLKAKIKMYLDASPQRVIDDRLELLLHSVQDALCGAYQNAGLACCGKSMTDCCGSPVTEWSEADQKIMDALSPIQRELSALLSAGKETA